MAAAKKEGKLIRFDDACKFVFVNTKPRSSLAPLNLSTSRADREAEAIKLDEAFSSVDAPIIAVKDDGVCIREPWAVLEDRTVRITRGGGLYLCTGEGGSTVAQSFDLRRVVNAAQLFFVQVSEVEDDERAARIDEFRLRTMTQFGSKQQPAVVKPQYARHDEPVRTAVVLVARKQLERGEEGEPGEQKRDFYPFVFPSRITAATFLRVVQTVMGELGIPFGESGDGGDASKAAEPSMTAAEGEHAETATRQQTDTSASQLLELLEGESDEDEGATGEIGDEDSPELNKNEFDLGEHEARQRDATIAQNMISRVTSIQETIIGPFSLINDAESAASREVVDSLLPALQEPDPVAVMEALNARKPEYFNKEGMHAFMSLCNSLYRDISKERRMKAFTELVHIRTCVSALHFLRTTTTSQIVQSWEHRRVLRRYHTQQYILDLQKYVASLRENVSSERELLHGAADQAALSEMIAARRGVCDNPLSKLTLADATSLDEAGQISFEGEYLNYLHEEASCLSEQLEIIRRIAAEYSDFPATSTSGAVSGSDKSLHSGGVELRLSNVFPDAVVSRLRMNT